MLLDNTLSLPAAVDWRTNERVTGVKNQGQCSASWAFSATGAVEGQMKQGQLVPLSEQNLIDCSASFGITGCHGGTVDNAFKYIMGSNGINTESSYRYEGQQETADSTQTLSVPKFKTMSTS